MTHYIDSFPDRELQIKGKKYLYFGGTSYLGLQSNGIFQETFIKNVAKYGTNHGASRKSNIRLKVYEEAETLLAELTGSEQALTLSSGYLAGQLVAQHFNTPEYRLYYAPNTHAALFNNYNKPYPSFEALNEDLRLHLKKGDRCTPVVFLDSIDFEGDNYPCFKGLKILPLNEIILVADDSHGFGIVGKNGSGIHQVLKKFDAMELLISCSLGKSFGIQAGAILGKTDRVASLVKSAFFGGASPAAPSAIATFNESQNIYELSRKALQSNIELFKSKVAVLDFFKYMPQHPAFTFQDEIFAQFMEDKGLIITNFNYPEESASVMSRIVISSHHTQNDIEVLAQTINSRSLK